MKNKYLFFAFVFLFMSSGLFSQTRLIGDNDNKGSKISDSGGLQQVWDSKTKIVKSKSWGDNFFYVIWADTGTLGDHSPLDVANANEEGLPNASIFAVKMKKAGNTYTKDTSFGSDSLLVITDRFDQSLREINAFPNGEGFVVVYSTSASGARVEGFVQYYNSSGVAQINSSGDGSGNKSFQLSDFNYDFPFTVSGDYVYYVYTDPAFKVKYCYISDSPTCKSTDNLGLTSMPANGFLIPYSHSTAPGVILGVQTNWVNEKFDIKIKKITPTSVSPDWIAVTNTGGVYVEWWEEDESSGYDGNMQGFYEEGGASYVIWADTNTTTIPAGIRIGKITVDQGNNVVLSTNGGVGYPLTHISIDDMSDNLDDKWYAANNGKIGLIYVDGSAKNFRLFNASNNFSMIGGPVLLSNTDLEDDQKFYFSINDAGYVSIFERDNAGNGGSLKVSGYKADMTQIFPPTVFLSSSTIDKTYYSHADIESIGNYFAVLEHEAVGNPPQLAYNLYAQVLSTAVPPLDNLTLLEVNQTQETPLAFEFKATDPNNIVGSIYTVQVSTVVDFSTIIYSTDVINANENNPKTLLTINGLTPGRTYYFRAKVRSGDIESGYSDTSESYGTEGDHSSELNIGKWSDEKINNAIIPVEPYDAQDGYVIDAGDNKSFYIWSHYDYNTDKTSIKAIEYNPDGSKNFEKDIITGIPYSHSENSDNGFGVVSDGANGFIVVWSSSSDTSQYLNISRFDTNGGLKWSNKINNGGSIFGGENEAKIIGGKAYVLYADSGGKGYFDSFDLDTGARNQIDPSINVSGDFIAEVAKTSDDKLILFYGIPPSISSKKIGSDGTITSGQSYSLSGISNDGDIIALPADDGGAYLVYADAGNNKLMVLKVGFDLAGVVKEVDGLYKQEWGDYTYDAIHTPHGLVFAYTKSSNGSYVKFVDDSFNEIKKDTYTFTFNDIGLSYNSKNDIVGLALPLNNLGVDNIYVAEYNATDGSQIITPIKAIQNIYGINRINNFYNPGGRTLNLSSAGDNFILNYISPENSYIQQISTYVVLNTPTISTPALATDSITFNWAENNTDVNEWYVRYSTGSDFDAAFTTEAYTTSNPYQATGLKPNTTYYFEVKSSSGVFSSGYSTPYPVSTLVVAPTGLAVSDRSSNSLEFSWSSQNGPGTLYNIVLLDGSNEVASSTATALSHLFDSLAPNKFYSAKVRAIGNNPDDISDYTETISTKTIISLEDVTAIRFTDVDTDTIRVEWTHPSGALRYDVQSSSVPAFDSVIITSNTANKYAVFGKGGEGTLTPNTTYYFRLKAYYNDEEAGYLNMGSTSTLAAQPTGFDFHGVYSSSVTLKWNSSNPEYTVYQVRYISNVDVSTETKLFSDLGTGDISATITSLKDGTTYTFYLSAINNNSIPTAEISITTMTVKIINAVEEIGASGGQMSFNPGTGSKIDLNFPANTFISITTVTVKLPDTPPSSNRSLMGNITPTGISFEIDSGGVQPSRGVEISINYQTSMIPEGIYSSGITVDENTLVIARYDSVNNLWIPLKSYVDKSAKTVTAYTDHFSVFSLFSLTPASTISEPKVAPNPLRPSKGLLYSKITFSNLPADTEIIIYNVSGTKVRKLKTDSSGMAVWDGKNDDGKNVASGVYFALIKKGSSTKTIKLGVQR
ncbi:MAG: fibronectin type III domain-containing protein [Elusimicrobiales bacterium]|nr:fibronectin type III domain-containing protein [Elusimicrobiales bacterium]